MVIASEAFVKLFRQHTESIQEWEYQSFEDRESIYNDVDYLSSSEEDCDSEGSDEETHHDNDNKVDISTQQAETKKFYGFNLHFNQPPMPENDAWTQLGLEEDRLGTVLEDEEL